MQEKTYTVGSNTLNCAEASDYQTLLDNNQVSAGNGDLLQTYKVSNANGIKCETNYTYYSHVKIIKKYTIQIFVLYIFSPKITKNPPCSLDFPPQICYHNIKLIQKFNQKNLKIKNSRFEVMNKTLIQDRKLKAY